MTHHDYAKILETELSRVTEQLNGIATHNSATDDWEAVPVGVDISEADQNEGADVVEEWNERRALVAVLETDYQNIKRALLKIEDGTYGICEICRAPIEEERLAVEPSARTCIAHQEEELTLSL